MSRFALSPLWELTQALRLLASEPRQRDRAGADRAGMADAARHLGTRRGVPRGAARVEGLGRRADRPARRPELAPGPDRAEPLARRGRSRPWRARPAVHPHGLRLAPDLAEPRSAVAAGPDLPG